MDRKAAPTKPQAKSTTYLLTHKNLRLCELQLYGPPSQVNQSSEDTPSLVVIGSC